jgi:hydroxymethylbilane synthase
MGLEKYIVEHLPTDTFVPPAGQASIALEIASSLEQVKQAALKLHCNHAQTQIAITNERTFLKAMDGGCSIPVFAHAYFESDSLVLHAGISSLDGNTIIAEKVKLSSSEFSNTLAAETLANEILAKGGAEILKEIKQQQSI